MTYFTHVKQIVVRTYKLTWKQTDEGKNLIVKEEKGVIGGGGGGGACVHVHVCACVLVCVKHTTLVL